MVNQFIDQVAKKEVHTQAEMANFWHEQNDQITAHERNL